VPANVHEIILNHYYKNNMGILFVARVCPVENGKYCRYFKNHGTTHNLRGSRKKSGAVPFMFCAFSGVLSGAAGGTES
jgi:hypothetical protein